VWRLGAKDPVPQEIGKAVRYLDREIVLHTQEVAPRPLFGLCPSDVAWYSDMARERIEERAMPAWRAAIMRALVQYTITGRLEFVRDAIHHFTMQLKADPDVGHGLAL